MGTTWQARIAARSKRQELDQSKEQARTRLHVDHVGRRIGQAHGEPSGDVHRLHAGGVDTGPGDARRQNRRRSVDRRNRPAPRGDGRSRRRDRYGPQHGDDRRAAGSRWPGRGAVPHPYRLASAVSAIYDESLDDGRQQAPQSAVAIRVNLVRELTRFSVMASHTAQENACPRSGSFRRTPQSPPRPSRSSPDHRQQAGHPRSLPTAGGHQHHQPPRRQPLRRTVGKDQLPPGQVRRRERTHPRRLAGGPNRRRPERRRPPERPAEPARPAGRTRTVPLGPG